MARPASIQTNWLDRLLGWFDPAAGLRRQQLRAAYEGAEKSRYRKARRDSGPNQPVQQAAASLRAAARHLERNHDIARGALRTLVNNVVGASGIGIEPQPRLPDGTVHTAYAAALREAWRDWCRCPEVSQRHHWTRLQRMAARSWLRDGEVFAQQLMGPVAKLDHGSRVPYSLELFEADRVPLDYQDGASIQQGIETNGWGRPVGYWVYRQHPLDHGSQANELRRISADRILHLALFDRIDQRRGVSEFAAILTRLEDLKDYEESERIAAKVAAMLTAYVKRGTPDLYDPSQTARDEHGEPLPRDLRLAPGMIIDSLAAGEDISLIDSNRPNPNLVSWRQGQLRAVAAGLGASYSSVSRDYNGTYSSQRQELVEQWVHYAVLTDEFTGQFVQPVWQSFVQTAHLAGIVPMPPDLDPQRADDALFVGQSMPWIDPMKEALAWETLTRAGFASELEVIRKRGAQPMDVLEQLASWRQLVKERGLVLSSAEGVTKPAPVVTGEAPE
ncbi:phage portal protein [Parachitinimonas caeni]|uniref:Phage portal protein n=1 Tax=Parachitinimonas caeni TaxID=3031301 RepID=A0ABT7DVS5_9NEIS|nr:phage portal protein [Parachitinimonas caeni]MDK2124157.1 phage portal protein [Parachitinimonas caeni]